MLKKAKVIGVARCPMMTITKFLLFLSSLNKDG